jgi:hypothetical protein
MADFLRQLKIEDSDSDDDDQPIVNEPKNKKKIREEAKEASFYVRSIFLIFTFVWMIVIILNKFYVSLAAWILLIPIMIFLLGFSFAEECCDCELADDIFSTSFMYVGVFISIPLLTLFNKDGRNRKLNHIVFLALISTLLAYLPMWLRKTARHPYKAARTCLETIAVTLYIFAIVIFFIDEK